MGDDVRWLTYRIAAAALGISSEAVAGRARRRRWSKRTRNDTGEVEIAIPADLLPDPAAKPPRIDQDTPPTRRSDVAPDVAGDAVRAAVAPLQAALEAQAAELQATRAALDNIRGTLADAQAGAAAAKARADTLHDQVEREVADRRALQGQADALRDQLADATGAAALERQRREISEKRLEDLERQLAEARKPRRWWWR